MRWKALHFLMRWINYTFAVSEPTEGLIWSWLPNRFALSACTELLDNKRCTLWCARVVHGVGEWIWYLFAGTYTFCCGHFTRNTTLFSHCEFSAETFGLRIINFSFFWLTKPGGARNFRVIVSVISGRELIGLSGLERAKLRCFGNRVLGTMFGAHSHCIRESTNAIRKGVANFTHAVECGFFRDKNLHPSGNISLWFLFGMHFHDFFLFRCASIVLASWRFSANNVRKSISASKRKKGILFVLCKLGCLTLGVDRTVRCGRGGGV